MRGLYPSVKDSNQSRLERLQWGAVVSPILVQHQVQGEQGTIGRPRKGAHLYVRLFVVCSLEFRDIEWLLPLEALIEGGGAACSPLHHGHKRPQGGQHQSTKRILLKSTHLSFYVLIIHATILFYLHGKFDEFHELLELGALVDLKVALLCVEPALGDRVQAGLDGRAQKRDPCVLQIHLSLQKKPTKIEVTKSYDIIIGIIIMICFRAHPLIHQNQKKK